MFTSWFGPEIVIQFDVVVFSDNLLQQQHQHNTELLANMEWQWVGLFLGGS